MEPASPELYFDVCSDSRPEKVRIYGPSEDSSFAVAMSEAEDEYPVRDKNLKGFTVLDIGAGYGEFSALCYLLGASKVIGFEPNANVFHYLTRNLRGFDVFELHQKAVASTSGSTVLYSRSTGTASGSISEVQYDPDAPSARDRSKQAVEMVAIKDILEGSEGPFLVKIDAEGVEYELIEMASRYDLLKNCDLIYIEYHRGVQQIAEFLMQMGFDVEIHQKDAEMGLINGTRGLKN